MLALGRLKQKGCPGFKAILRLGLEPDSKKQPHKPALLSTVGVCYTGVCAKKARIIWKQLHLLAYIMISAMRRLKQGIASTWSAWTIYIRFCLGP